MDRKLAEHRFPSDEVLSAFNQLTGTEEELMKSLQNPDHAIAASSSVVSLQQVGVEAVTAEQLELDNGQTAYKITTDGVPSTISTEALEDLVDVTDRVKPELQEDGTSFILKEGV